MKKLHPGRAWYALFSLCVFAVFMLGAAIWHVLLDADSLDCSMKGVICLFIPDRSDWNIHLISYILMLPLMSTMFLWFKSYRRQWIHTRVLISNLAPLTSRNGKLEKLARRLRLQNRVYLLDSDDYISFCTHCISPRIYVSRAVVEKLNDDELEALLLHEKYHLENRDPLKIFLGQLVVSAFFFIPVLKDLFKQYLVGKEIDADQNAIRYQGNRRGITGALQKLLQRDIVGKTTAFAVSGTDTLRYRIEHLFGREYKEGIPLLHIAISSLVLLLVVGIIFASLTVFRL